MKDVREAAQIAKNYLRSFFPHADNIKLEEVELDENQQYWYITLSFYEYDKDDPFSPGPIEKNMKIFRIDAENGKVVSMKIRQLT